jgi:SAM domain (Sterile alpha motif)
MEEEATSFGDDIKPLEWLQEIDLAQYVETFQVNFTIGGSYLSRKRLASVRLQDFSKMNIQIFDHQKKLLQHIQHSLKYSFNDPTRKQEVQDRMQQNLLRESEIVGASEEITSNANDNTSSEED